MSDETGNQIVQVPVAPSDIANAPATTEEIQAESTVTTGAASSTSTGSLPASGSNSTPPENTALPAEQNSPTEPTQHANTSPIPAPTQFQILKEKMTALSALGRQAKLKRRQAKYDRIMTYVEKHKKITNDQTAHLTIVSHTTAWKLLEHLRHEGKLIRHGHLGPSVYYTKP